MRGKVEVFSWSYGRSKCLARTCSTWMKLHLFRIQESRINPKIGAGAARTVNGDSEAPMQRTSDASYACPRGKACAPKHIKKIPCSSNEYREADPTQSTQRFYLPTYVFNSACCGRKRQTQARFTRTVDCSFGDVGFPNGHPADAMEGLHSILRRCIALRQRFMGWQPNIGVDVKFGDSTFANWARTAGRPGDFRVLRSQGHLVPRLFDWVIDRGRARTRTSALQPAGRPALHSVHYTIMRSRY